MDQSKKSFRQKKCLPKNEVTLTVFMPNGPKVANIIILSQYFGSSFKARGAPIIISILLKPI